MDFWPRIGNPMTVTDWNKTAAEYDTLAVEADLKGDVAGAEYARSQADRARKAQPLDDTEMCAHCGHGDHGRDHCAAGMVGSDDAPYLCGCFVCEACEGSGRSWRGLECASCWGDGVMS